jgi:hypothetical protein
MSQFRALLVLIFVVVAAYTLVVVSNHGLGLFSVFFGDIAEMDWPGQFNLDFLGFLTLSACWLAWRNDFTPAGLALGVLGFFLGVPFLTGYLLFASLSADGDPRVLLLGPRRAAR